MTSFVEYVKLRKDITFKERPFNELDALVCSMISYIHWEDIEFQENMTLASACRLFIKNLTVETRKNYTHSMRLVDLIEVLQDTKRYQKVTLSNYEKYYCNDEIIQFGVITLNVENICKFISFRGTDVSILGWQEDLTMLYKSDLKCHHLARDYVSKIIDGNFLHVPFYKKIKKKKIYIGGHSKGGNFAMAGAIMAANKQSYIDHVYNFDGPGFLSEYYQKYDTSKISPKITSYLPEASIIGRMLEHVGNQRIVRAMLRGMVQHDASTWCCDIDMFEDAPFFTVQSDNMVDTIATNIMSLDQNTREEYFKAIINILNKMQVETINELNGFSMKKAFVAMQELSNLNSSQRKFIIDLVFFLWKETKVVRQIKK